MTLVRAFFYGFAFFLGTIAVLDAPYYFGTTEQPIFGYAFAVKIGLVGGVSGVASAAGAKLLFRLWRELSNV